MRDFIGPCAEGAEHDWHLTPGTDGYAQDCAKCNQSRDTPQALLRPARDSNPKTRFGMAKTPLSLVPTGALVHMAEAFRDGAIKYGPANWRIDPVSVSTYLNAAQRHILSWQDGEETASDSGVHHLGHAAACLAIILDAQHANSLIDDRPPPAPTGDLLKRLTKPMT